MELETKISQSNRDMVTHLEEKIEGAQGIFFTDFTGLSVAEMNVLRGKFFEAGDVEYVVAKNTLMSIALKNKGFTGLDDTLRGPTALAIGYKDPVVPAKLIADFARKYKKPTFKGGLIDGEFYDEARIETLKNLPSREQLVAQIVGAVASPLSGIVGVLNETVRSFLGVLDAIIEKKRTEEGA